MNFETLNFITFCEGSFANALEMSKHFVTSRVNTLF